MADRFDGRFELPFLMEEHSQEMQGFRMIRIRSQDIAVSGLRLGQEALFMMREGFVKENSGRFFHPRPWRIPEEMKPLLSANWFFNFSGRVDRFSLGRGGGILGAPGGRGISQRRQLVDSLLPIRPHFAS